MVKFEIVIDIPLDESQPDKIIKSNIQLNILRREDANKQELKMAKSMEQIFDSILTSSIEKAKSEDDTLVYRKEKITKKGGK